MKKKDAQEIEKLWILCNTTNNNKQILLLTQLKNYYIYNDHGYDKVLLTKKY
jgi:hypothetical protein